ncbi:MAG: DUF115 domain-containing protein, partial [Lachnospiraceae bacterium]|nr:DUF115 domain-containing protein [Lachnospiraceae bacterium]
KREGVCWAFDFAKEWFPLVGFLHQVPKAVLEKVLRREDEYAIWGYSALGIVIYDYLKERGCSCRFISEENIDGNVICRMRDKLGFETATVEECVRGGYKILLSVPMDEVIYESFAENEVESYYDLSEKTLLFHNPLLEQFKEVHKGKRCFIVATGPSLRMEDLDTLHDNNEICIGVNGVLKAFDKTLWRPDYYVVGDDAAYRMWKDEILSADIKAKFIADYARAGKEAQREDIFRWHLILRGEAGEKPWFSEDFSEGGYVGYTVTYDGALQLAAYMGFSEIYLLGVDCTRADGVETKHFDDAYYTGEAKKNTYRLNVDANRLAYQAAKEYADSHGFRIYNATRGGELEIFERVDFDSLFRKG